LVGEGKQTSYILKHPQENTLFAVQESAELVTSSSEMSGGLYVYHIEADGKLSKV
jgi:6-phosphogluconolactonase (cycloisomerase 2 family)